MSTISLRLPESLHEHARELAKKENISINRFIASAVAEKISVLLAGEYLEKRATDGGSAHFKRALTRVADRDAIMDDIEAFAKTVKVKRRFNLRELIEDGRK